MTIVNFGYQKIDENKTNTKSEEKENIKVNENNENETNKSSATAENEETDTQWGYDMYPERRGNPQHGFFRKYFWDSRENLSRRACEINVYKCIKKNPLINLLLAALKSSGCPFDIHRHVSCESCDSTVSGGFDAEFNQIVICYNTARNENRVGGVLGHELIHMFDYCRNEMDFKNVDHVACTEIRAANLVHCSFMSAMVQGQASPFNIKKAHQYCVKNLAKASLMASRKMTESEARKAVEKVFPMCYNDLEPIGRRIRRKSEDMHRAYLEGPLYGYIYDN